MCSRWKKKASGYLRTRAIAWRSLSDTHRRPPSYFETFPCEISASCARRACVIWRDSLARTSISGLNSDILLAFSLALAELGPDDRLGHVGLLSCARELA